MLRNWLAEWKRFGRVFGTQRKTSRRQRFRSARVPHQAEVLEDRTLLSTFYVDNATDYVITTDQGATGLDNGDTVTWDTAGTHAAGPVAGLRFGTDAFSTIQDAVNAAAASADATDTIDVAAGTFTENVTIDTNVDIIGTTNAVVDGNAAGTVFTINAGNTVTLDSLTIQNGSTFFSGGGINNASTLTLRNSTVQNNSAFNDAGGISNDGTLTVNGSTIGSNTAAVGGGIQNFGTATIQGGSQITGNIATGNNDSSSGGGIFNVGTLTVDGSTISSNTATGTGAGGIGGGGGIDNLGTATIQGGSQITANSATGVGGGILNDGMLTVDASTIGTNTALRGGGIFNSGGSGGSVALSNSTITANNANLSGGAVDSESTFTVTASTIDSNISGGGGGGISNSNALTLTNSTVSGNTARTNGGGIDTGTATATVEINNSTIANNRADSAGTSAGTGGGIHHDNAGSVTLTSTIVATNFVGTGTTGSDVSGTVDGTFNLIGVDTGLSGLTDGMDNNLVGTAASPIDPLLEPLADNGGPTRTQAILSSSPALDAGDNPLSLTTDQRGTPFVRTFGSQTDIGALEVQFLPSTFYVDNATDYVITTDQGAIGTLDNGDTVTWDTASTHPDGPVTGLTFGTDAFASIQDAVDAAAANGTGLDTIDVAAGTFTENVTINTNVNIIGTTGAIVDGGASGSVFKITAGNTVTLDSLTIQNGSAIDGGGIFNAGTLTLSNSTVQNNSASGDGGGIFTNSGSTLTVNGSTVSTNTAQFGGGIANFGGTATIQGGSQITGNTAGADGGGIYNAGTLTVDGSSTIGQFLVENDVWSQSAPTAGDLVFAFVDAQNSTAGQDVLLDVLENDGSTVIDNFNNGISAGGAVTQGGDVFYNVQANPFGGDEVTPYEIYASVVDPSAAVPETESNDTSVTANAISEETLITGDLGSATDQDYFSISVTDPNSSLVVILDSLAGTDAVVELLGTDGSTVLATGTVDDFSKDSAAIASGLSIGMYFIRVTGNAGATGGYQFVAKTVAPATDQVAESEPNNDTANADLLAAGKFGQGNLVDVGGNTAINGGGIYNTGTATVTGFTLISDNTATGNSSTEGGGGIYNDGGTLTVNDFSSIENNAATGTSGSGGGIFNNTSGTMTVTDASITANTANRAGGGIEDNSGTGLGVTLTSVTLDNNVAQGTPGNGGGLHVTGAGDVSITGGTVSGNSAANEGGGLWNGSGTTTIDGVTIDSNTAGNDGGGIFNNSGTATIQNSATITGNSASQDGGGIYNDATLTVDGSTIGTNTAQAGGGIYNNAGTATIQARPQSPATPPRLTAAGSITMPR